MSHGHGHEEEQDLSEMNLEVVTYLGYEIKIYTPQHACSICPDCAEERHDLAEEGHGHEGEHEHDHDLHCNHHCPYDHECPHCHIPHNCIDKHVCPENEVCEFCHEGHVMPAAVVIADGTMLHLKYQPNGSWYGTHLLYGYFKTPLDIAKQFIHFTKDIPRINTVKDDQ